MRKRRTLFRRGDMVKLSTETPIYEDGVDISGNRGRVINKFKKGKVHMYRIKLTSGRLKGKTISIGFGWIAAPAWFTKLSVREMEKLIKRK